MGAFSDNNDGYWSNDSMAACSSWENPDFAWYMEKPEVVAVGGGYTMTTSAAGGNHLTAVPTGGTSYATPQVAGQVALLLALDNLDSKCGLRPIRQPS